MPSIAPLYTADNTRFAYQLLWGLSVFWHSPPGTDGWLPDLQTATEPDDIRILKHRFLAPSHSQFLVSTTPSVVPVLIPARVKGRLQHLLRASAPRAFQRNYALRSIGSTKREKLEEYVSGQVQHHPMADPRVQERLQRYQISQSDVDLSQPRYTSHGKFWYNLHIAMVNTERWMEIRDEVLAGQRDMLLRAGRAKGHLLSRAGILPDHVHLTLGCALEESPQTVALSYMNNMAYVSGMRPVLQFSCYVGTFGEYDVGVC